MLAIPAEKSVILVVDDTPTNLSVLFKVLSDSNFKVLVAIDGESAIEQIQYTRPDLILLDVMMPGVDGFETCRRLKINPATKEIPVIFLTALSETVDKVKGFQLGAVDYITKPIQHEEILIRIQTHLTINHLQQQLQEQNEQLQQEIVQRHQAEAVLRESEAKYRTLIEQIPAVTYIAALDDLCTKLYVSPRVKQMLGFEPGEWQQQPDLWLNQIYPEDRQEVLSKLYLSQSSGKPFSCEYRILSKGGRVVWVHDAAALVRDEMGKLLSFQGVMFNITTHKQAEESLRGSEAKNRALLNAIPDLIYCLNRDGVIIDYRATKDSLNILPYEELIGQNIQQVFSEELAYWTMYQVEQVLSTGQPQCGEYVQQLQDKWHNYEARHVAMGADHVLVLVRDISERKHLEAALIESQAKIAYKTQQLEQALVELQSTQSQLIHNAKMVSLGQLVAGIAHEINNPANFIYGNINHANGYAQDLLNLLQLYQHYYPQPVEEIQSEIEGLDLEFLSQDFKNLIKSMLHGVERIRKIVQSLQTFSNLDKSEKKRVNLHEGIDSVLLILQNRLESNSDYPSIKVVKEYGDLPLVECYPGELNQVFLNLLTNAIDTLQLCIPDGVSTTESKSKIQPTIRICTEYVRNQAMEKVSEKTPSQIAKSDYIKIGISDNGCGIPEALQNKIFDPFFTTKPVGQGTGLGLFISHQIIVKKHQGDLQCVSQPQQGAEFIIILPK